MKALFFSLVKINGSTLSAIFNHTAEGSGGLPGPLPETREPVVSSQ